MRQIGIIGAGAGGIAEACRIKLQYPYIKVILYNRATTEHSRQKLKILKEIDKIRLKEVYKTYIKPDIITSSLKQTVNKSDLIIITTTADAHPEIAEKIANYLEDGQLILLFSGGIGDKLIVGKILRDLGSSADVTLADTDTFIYACKIDKLIPKDIQIRVKAKKKKLYLATLPSNRANDVIKYLHSTIYPDQFIKIDNPLAVGIGDGPGFHVVGMVMEEGRIEKKEDFNFYLAFTEEMTKKMERMDEERKRVALAMGIKHCPTLREFLNTVYGIKMRDDKGQRRSLFGMVHSPLTPYFNLPGEKIRSLAPKTMNYRYLWEEMLTRVVPLYKFAQILGIDLPLHKELIQKASFILERNFMNEGRDPEQMGLTNEDIKNWRTSRLKFEERF